MLGRESQRSSKASACCGNRSCLEIMVCCVVWYGRVGKGRAVEVWSFAVVDLVPEPSRTPRFSVVRSGSGSGSIHERSMKGRNGFRGGGEKGLAFVLLSSGLAGVDG
jgi:uncharacterized membrane protein YgcG